MLEVELALVTGGENYMIMHGLDLQPSSRRLATVISLYRWCGRLLNPGREALLNLGEPLVVATGGGEAALPEELTRRRHFSRLDGRPSMDAGFQFFNQSPGKSSVLFGCHVCGNLKMD